MVQEILIDKLHTVFYTEVPNQGKYEHDLIFFTVIDLGSCFMDTATILIYNSVLEITQKKLCGTLFAGQLWL